MCNDVQQYLTLSYKVQPQYNQVMMLRHCYMDMHHVTTLLHYWAIHFYYCTPRINDVIRCTMMVQHRTTMCNDVHACDVMNGDVQQDFNVALQCTIMCNDVTMT